MTATTQRPGHDRTVRLLAAQLEAIAVATERMPPVGRAASARLEPQVQRAATATRNAVALELMTNDEADAIWAAVERRHPTVRWEHPQLAPGPQR